ncbi:hypothetical protein LC087_02735 [Bacillus carboniphilus]|uniref:Uncharacterized protein n=1 Tax=Bacillus carboniphilus TaxID=86663 RepID=A0ABY9JXH5_9BACI|nr:hypothetical protein [Bacillus carboniphilus]WLR43140.1 hypothetical protein LC087_02735 [Bacillus carboniphilus]
MKEVILVIADIVNQLHDVIIELSQLLGLNLTDKELHFWVIGLVGLFLFAPTQYVFKKLAKLSITSISFIYTFTILVVIVFAIEIQQKIMDSGNMEFDDAVLGLWGFIVMFFVCYFFVLMTRGVKRFILKQKRGRPSKKNGSSRMSKHKTM